jgi:hypothetical protein
MKPPVRLIGRNQESFSSAYVVIGNEIKKAAVRDRKAGDAIKEFAAICTSPAFPLDTFWGDRNIAFTPKCAVTKLGFVTESEQGSSSSDHRIEPMTAQPVSTGLRFPFRPF